jgi:hypothetical protein
MKDNNNNGGNNNDNRTNANDNNNKSTYTKDGLKSLLKPSPFDFLLRDQYKYKSADGRHYILAIHETGLDGKDRTYWSKYRYDNDDIREGKRGENNMTPSGIFNEMILMENRTREGHEQVIVR